MTTQLERLRAVATEDGKSWEQEAVYAAFFATRPDSAEHLAFIARAAKRYPNLPRGAQQAALWALETRGPKAAAKYAANAARRWAIQGFKFVMPKRSTRGICKYSKSELAERMERYHAHMAEGARNLERQRRAAQKKYGRELKAATAAAYPKFKAAINASTSANP